MEFISGALQKARMLRRCDCAIAVPILPGDVPMIAAGLRANEFWPQGRLAQSMAFFSPPGIDRKSTRLNSSHSQISYAVFGLKKKRDRSHKIACRTSAL